MAQQEPTPSSDSNPLQTYPSLTSSEPSQAALDWQQLHELADGDREFEQELLQIFVSDTLAHLESLRNAIATQDCGKTEQAAHQIRGASASVGAVRVQAIATQIEQQARQKQLQGSDRLLADLETALQKVKLLTLAPSDVSSA